MKALEANLQLIFPAAVLGRDSGPYRIRWRFDRPHLQHGKEPSLVASLDWRGPGIGSRRLGMAFSYGGERQFPAMVA